MQVEWLSPAPSKLYQYYQYCLSQVADTSITLGSRFGFGRGRSALLPSTPGAGALTRSAINDPSWPFAAVKFLFAAEPGQSCEGSLPYAWQDPKA